MKAVIRTLIITLLLVPGLRLRAQFWPKEFSSSQGKVVLYQPQPQKLEGNKVSGVQAFSLLPNGKKEPNFGALFFEGRLEIDRDTRQYALESVAIPNLKFSGKPEGLDEEKVKTAIINEAKNWELQGKLDELIASIDEYQETGKKENFRNDPPKFIWTTTSSFLIMIDGAPKMEDIKNTDLRRVANTGYTIFENKSDRSFYLFGGEIWYTAKDLRGPWQLTKNIPKDITKLLEQNKEAVKASAKVDSKGQYKPPAIVVATEPTELIQSDGAPVWKKIDSANIDYVDNTTDNLFRIGSTFYVLKSGRWFTSQSLSSGWRYLPSEELPREFAKIPSGSDKDVVLASVPGTVEARDALLDAQLPQTATVDRKTGGKDQKVQYDGKPVYERIPGTSLDLVQNSDKVVFRTTTPMGGGGGGNSVAHDQPKYYMVNNGIWYTSSSPDGPWYVSDSRPPDVENIPPSSSAYNTKYVQVYDQTPDVVYVGYTPGYMGSYVYGPTVVYGTGYPYNPWMGSYYYPHHSTWGFNMNYNPWTGWSIGFGFSTGPFHFGFGTGGFSFGMSWGFGVPMWGYPYYGGWFGPPIYRPPCFNPHYPWYGYNRPGYNNRPNINGPGAGNINWGGGNQINIGGDVNININNGSGNSIGNNNLYNKAAKRDKSISSGVGTRDMSKLNMGGQPGREPNRKPGTGPGANNKLPGGGGNAGPANRLPDNKATTADKIRPSAKPSDLPNNVFADRDGNIYQKDKGGNVQQNKGGNNWDRPATMPSTRPSVDSRDRVNNKANNYPPVNRPSPGYNRPPSRPAPSARPAPRPAPSARPAPRPSGVRR